MCKCAVEECSNSVKQPGSLCKDCMEKYVDDEYVIMQCSICDQLIFIRKPSFTLSEMSKILGSRIIPLPCDKCQSEIDSKPIDPSDLDELIDDE